MVASAFNGLATAAWTGWVFFAVLVGPVLIWVYTVSDAPCSSVEYTENPSRPFTQSFPLGGSMCLCMATTTICSIPLSSGFPFLSVSASRSRRATSLRHTSSHMTRRTSISCVGYERRTPADGPARSSLERSLPRSQHHALLQL